MALLLGILSWRQFRILLWITPQQVTQPPSNGCDAWDANCSAPAYQRGNKRRWDDATTPPSAPPLDLLLEDTYFEETGGRELNRPTPTSHTLAHGDGGRAGMRIRPNPEPIKLNAALQEHQSFPPPETKLVAVPICEAVQMGPIPTQDNDSRNDLPRRIQRYKLGLASLGLVAAAVVIAVAIVAVSGKLTVCLLFYHRQ